MSARHSCCGAPAHRAAAGPRRAHRWQRQQPSPPLLPQLPWACSCGRQDATSRVRDQAALWHVNTRTCCMQFESVVTFRSSSTDWKPEPAISQSSEWHLLQLPQVQETQAAAAEKESLLEAGALHFIQQRVAHARRQGGRQLLRTLSLLHSMAVSCEHLKPLVPGQRCIPGPMTPAPQGSSHQAQCSCMRGFAAALTAEVTKMSDSSSAVHRRAAARGPGSARLIVRDRGGAYCDASNSTPADGRGSKGRSERRGLPQGKQPAAARQLAPGACRHDSMLHRATKSGRHSCHRAGHASCSSPAQVRGYGWRLATGACLIPPQTLQSPPLASSRRWTPPPGGLQWSATSVA